jgi:argininosuccinate lyase
MELGTSKMDMMLSTLEKVLSTLSVNKERTRKWVAVNYSLTTDLADYIAQKMNVGYRLVYKVVGKAVDELISKGKPFTEMKAADIIRIGTELGIKLELSEDELKQAIDPINCINKRTHIGGSNETTMREMMTRREKSLEQKQEWMGLHEKKITEAIKRTDSLVDKIIGVR